MQKRLLQQTQRLSCTFARDTQCARTILEGIEWWSDACDAYNQQPEEVDSDARKK